MPLQFADSILELRAGPTIGGSTVLTQAVNTVSPARGEFERATLTWQSPLAGAEIGETLILVLRSNSLVSLSQTHFDNVTLTATPEPGTFAPLGAALAGLAAWRRRR